MRTMKACFIAIFILVVAVSVSTAGSFSDSATSFKPGDKYYNASYLDNCVLYARWLQKTKLPSGLCTLADKKAIIKTSSNPKKGYVAVLDIFTQPADGYCNGKLVKKGTPVGHVAYVADTDNSGKEKSITLYEANNPGHNERKHVLKGKDKSMKDIEKHFNIIGYWKP